MAARATAALPAGGAGGGLDAGAAGRQGGESSLPDGLHDSLPPELFHRLVLDYLLGAGFPSTARCFQVCACHSLLLHCSPPLSSFPLATLSPTTSSLGGMLRAVRRRSLS